MAFCRRVDDGPLIVVFGSSFQSSTKKNVVKVGPPLRKLSGSAHENNRDNVLFSSLLIGLSVDFLRGWHVHVRVVCVRVCACVCACELTCILYYLFSGA